MKKIVKIMAGGILAGSALLGGRVWADGEVDRDKIPAERMEQSCKLLPWGVAVWDNAEAIVPLRDRDGAVLWIDTRPASFYRQGTVRGAILLVYDRKENPVVSGEPELTEESLAAAVEEAGNPSKIVFFCQGPFCHRSYNATWRAVKEWGYAPERIIWYRDGYPELYKALTEDAALRRRANRYLCDAGVAALP